MEVFLNFPFGFYPSATSAEGVLSSPVSVRLSVRPSVRPSVCVSVRKTLLVRMITFERTDLESPNLVYLCILEGSRLGLFVEWFDLDLQGHLGSKRSKSAKSGLVCMITFEKLNLGSPNWTSRRIRDRFKLGLYMVKFDLDLQGRLRLNIAPE